MPADIARFGLCSEAECSSTDSRSILGGSYVRARSLANLHRRIKSENGEIDAYRGLISVLFALRNPYILEYCRELSDLSNRWCVSSAQDCPCNCGWFSRIPLSPPLRAYSARYLGS